MKKLKLRIARLESLTENKVIFIGELKGYIQKLSYTITHDRFNDLKQIDMGTRYNIWEIDNTLRFIEQ